MMEKMLAHRAIIAKIEEMIRIGGSCKILFSRIAVATVINALLSIIAVIDIPEEDRDWVREMLGTLHGLALSVGFGAIYDNIESGGDHFPDAIAAI